MLGRTIRTVTRCCCGPADMLAISTTLPNQPKIEPRSAAQKSSSKTPYAAEIMTQIKSLLIDKTATARPMPRRGVTVQFRREGAGRRAAPPPPRRRRRSRAPRVAWPGARGVLRGGSRSRTRAVDRSRPRRRRARRTPRAAPRHHGGPPRLRAAPPLRD